MGTFTIANLALAANANPVTAQTASGTSEPAAAGSIAAGSSANATNNEVHITARRVNDPF